MIISSICAMARNRVIGKDGLIPWHLPSDLANFKRLTFGKTIIMGRHTMQSLGRPLPGRQNLVVSNHPELILPGFQVFNNLASALHYASDIPEIFIIGGAQLYSTALPMVQRQYLSLLHIEVSGDAFYPEFDSKQWQVVEHQSHRCDSIPWNFLILERVIT